MYWQNTSWYMVMHYNQELIFSCQAQSNSVNKDFNCHMTTDYNELSYDTISWNRTWWTGTPISCNHEKDLTYNINFSFVFLSQNKKLTIHRKTWLPPHPLFSIFLQVFATKLSECRVEQLFPDRLTLPLQPYSIVSFHKWTMIFYEIGPAGLYGLYNKLNIFLVSVVFTMVL